MLDFHNRDWPKINILKEALNLESLAIRICTQEKFKEKLNKVVDIITELLNENLDKLKPSPFS
jgi:flagellin-specific chaperone FliS